MSRRRDRANYVPQSKTRRLKFDQHNFAIYGAKLAGFEAQASDFDSIKTDEMEAFAFTSLKRALLDDGVFAVPVKKRGTTANSRMRLRKHRRSAECPRKRPVDPASHYSCRLRLNKSALR